MTWHIALEGGILDGETREIPSPEAVIVIPVTITPPSPLIAYPGVHVPAVPIHTHEIYRNTGFIRSGVLIFRHERSDQP